MPHDPPRVTFEPVELKDGSGWYVRATLPGGRDPHIEGFRTETEARRWIKEDSAAWLREYEGGKYV